MDNSSAANHLGIGNGLRRLLNARAEERIDTESQTAVLNHRGHRHVVRVANISASGAMIIFSGDLATGDELVLQLLDRGSVGAQVRWARDGRAGVSFNDSTDSKSDD